MKKALLIFILVFSQNLLAQSDLLVPVINENNSKGVERFSAEVFTKQLISLQENNLQNYKCNCEMYRFLWLRSFHNPISITIANIEEKISLNWKRTNAEGDYETGILVENKTIALDLEKWNNFKELLNTSNYWKNPSILVGEDIIEVLDGASWVIEGIANNKYHLSEINVTELGRFLIENTEMDIPENEIY